MIPGFGGHRGVVVPPHPQTHGAPRRVFGARVPSAPPPVPVSPLASVAGLLPYQIAPAQDLVAALRRWGGAIDASDPGIGKTYQVLAAARELSVRPLVVCPKAVVPAWPRVAAHMGIELAGVVSYGQLRAGNTPWGSWSGPGKKFFRWSERLPLIIWDEAHALRNGSTQNSRLLVGACRAKIRNALLSATLADSPLHLKAAGLATKMHNGVDFWTWSRRYGCRRSYVHTGMEFAGDATDLERLHHDLFPSRGVRVRKDDLGDAFPETQILADLYQLDQSGQLNRHYQGIAEALQRKAEEAAEHLTEQLHRRQAIEILKVPLLASLARDAVMEGQHVAMFVNFQDSLQALADLLKTECVIHGAQTGRERQRCIDDFQADREPFIVCNMQAGGAGIGLHDTHGNHPRLSLISPSFSAVHLRQALGRVHRAEARTKSIQRIVLVAGSVEEHIQEKLQNKLSRLDAINDGDLTP